MNIKTKEKFRAFYKEKLLTDFFNLEIERKKYFRIFVINFLISAIVFPYVGKLLEGVNEDIAEIIIGVVGIACFGAIIYPVVTFQGITKDKVMDKILSFFGSIKRRHSGISDYDIIASELVGAYTSRSTDDAFVGQYNGVNILVSEDYMTRGNGKSKTTVFNGFFILLDFNKKFVGKTIVKAKYTFLGKFVAYICLAFCFVPTVMCLVTTDRFSLFEFGVCAFWVLLFYLIFRNKFNKKKREEVKLEDVVFSKKWNVFATDQIEARYLLTPALMERILKVKKLFHGRSIEFSFFDNKLLIAVHTSKDMFEATTLFKSTLNYKRVEEVYEQFVSIFSVIDELKIERSKVDEKN